MTAAVETMMYKGEKPWHGLGVEIDGASNFWEAFDAAGLDWEVECQPLYREVAEADRIFPWMPAVRKISKARATVRDSDSRMLGVVGNQYVPLQNRDAFQVFEPMVESGELEIETAGSLKNGERVWVLAKLAKLDRAEVVTGDPVDLYALLSNGHDGKLSVHFGLTPIRVVCSNTEAMARKDKASKLIRVRHGQFVKRNVEALRDVMNTAKGEFETTVEQYQLLASRQINSKDLDKYVRLCLDIEQDDAKIKTRSQNILTGVKALHDAGIGSDIPGVQGTLWGAYNAVTEYLSYHKGRSNENRMDSLWFGQNGNLNRESLKIALTMAS